MSGVQTRYYQEGRALTIDRCQDVEPILEDNKYLQTLEQDRHSSFRHIARIPNVILERWFNEERARGNTTIQWGREEMDRLIQRKLADPDWAYLRVDRKQIFI